VTGFVDHAKAVATDSGGHRNGVALGFDGRGVGAGEVALEGHPGQGRVGLLGLLADDEDHVAAGLADVADD
jgi:hypothetical protein